MLSKNDLSLTGRIKHSVEERSPKWSTFPSESSRKDLSRLDTAKAANVAKGEFPQDVFELLVLTERLGPGLCYELLFTSAAIL